MSDPNDLNLAPWPKDDFAAYGEVDVQPIPRIQQLVGSFLGRNWVRIPHVFHQDDADITGLDELRKTVNRDNPETKLTPLPFFIKAMVETLKAYPQFNASLDGDGNIVYKKYFHVGVAVDTPGGLLVPVIRDCDKKSIHEIAAEVAAISEKARTKGLSTAEMAGGCMTISSLGHIGGTGFTPIINAPQVAILGITKAEWKPVVRDGEVVTEYRVPLSLSYDHRVINGVDAAKFCVKVAEVLAQPQLLLD
ncbi:dihydrolipoamide acetyltransferase [Pseudomaricurvus alkylphenolicus]|uniref:2-oxo acid dehydrogenase subunit E2 n=1 Tax=Pseudomaricurvus alkylphenolicus TaxID=1306991 RepID=UPI001423D543|nr:2-oxo acid dehydrogenase subunit E2 [Pseudomaricurvus alkylphenolicus]NIB38875.1 dihydrolipoamide acetyltransferase [Pseudomaricurvus alkylphenolicus]